ncbi:hypothetical protein PPROV_001015900 [Pycnococcus provasolii]|uniref:60S ribosomal protein L18a n=1 Tax=Pycnococcus provasolii TaxID=41880 RepID=A0A830I135_9CHLO|nr:hypothetical protein PPROV_001015900 [Pycnococcus provasolii]|mmetsp:Transcript_4002/g.8965  ORF Transcript_4002/g.8965 Transcript_4002/m.8965 type:complete len:180 (-) Transcript_4002:317-856(-)|eukprot:CAMPEP_0119192204 /NCGR_PEP_ID=MMETSP1316-20130426/2781_1 /TAXON_ID=41880 /ORGANISM="Pycnococcus provasolii, Strain RCC2336" /LENGTH=179 /DNA_ID=CAMNT_0007187347 /DNA_START=258 /DNA_END=797 /DNA_ORIENTATION=-
MPGKYRFKQFQVIGRHVPTEREPSPKLYRMKLWATDAVRARSKFFYFISKIKKVKRANGQIVSCNEIHETDSTTTKNYGIWIRYLTRTGYTNGYKEYRDVTLNGAVEQLYQEMASRHRVRMPEIQIIKTHVLENHQCRRENVTMFHNDEVKFPDGNKHIRPTNKSFKTTFKAVRPSVNL